MLLKGFNKGGAKGKVMECHSWLQVLLHAQGYQNAYSFFLMRTIPKKLHTLIV